MKGTKGMKEGANNIREALTECGFDWDSGKVYLANPSPDEHGLMEVPHNDPGLDVKGNYFASDKGFAYMSCVMSIFGRQGIFLGKVRLEAVDVIEINLDVFFDGDPLKQMLKEVIGGIKVVSMLDATPKPSGLELHIVGSKDVPFFVVALSEEEAIRIFFERIRHSARQSVANRALENLMVAAMMQGIGPDGDGCGDPDCQNCNPKGKGKSN